MRKASLAVIWASILFPMAHLFAQSNFIRPSVSVVEIVSPNEYPKIIPEAIEVPNQFDENSILTRTVSSDKRVLYDSREFTDDDALRLFEGQKIGTQEVSYVLPVIDGRFSNRIIKQRGMYSATDARINALKGSETEKFSDISDNFGDIGLQQLDKIYTVMIYVYNYREVEHKDGIHYNATAKYFFIKTDNALNAYARYKSAPDSLKTAQWKGTVRRSGTVSLTSEGEELWKQEKPSLQEVRREFSNRLTNAVFDDILRTVEEVQPRTTVIMSGRRPTAKIGSKEGLSIDNRFYVYEQTLVPNTKDSTRLRRVSQLRVKKVGHNLGIASGNSDPSYFYKIAGRRVTDGMLLVQKEDVGIGIMLGYGTMQWFRIDYRIKGITPGFKVFVGVNDPTRFSGRLTFDRTRLSEQLSRNGLSVRQDDLEVEPSYSGFSFSVGVEKAFILNSRLQAVPFLGFGATFLGLPNSTFYNVNGQVLRWKDNSGFLAGFSVSPGCRLVFNISGSVSLVGSVGYGIFLGGAYKDLKYANSSNTDRYLLGNSSEEKGSATEPFYNGLITKNPAEINELLFDAGLRFEF